MPDIVRVGIVGLGFGERVLLPAFQAHPSCEVAGVASARTAHAREVAAREGVTAYDDWRALVADPGVDVVVVATPPATHAPIAIAACQAGKHVLCEKPLADTLEAATAMASAFVGGHSANMVDFEFPDIPEWERARSLLAAGALGRLRHATVSWHVETYANRERLDNWKTSVAHGGGALSEFASHSLYYLEWLLGPIESLWAAPHDESGPDVLVILSLRFRGGVTGSVSISTAAPFGDGHSIMVYGDEGALMLKNTSPDYARGFTLSLGTRASGALQPVPVIWASGDTVDGRTVVAGRLIDRLVDWIRFGRPAHPSFADGVRVQTLLDTAWRSRRQMSWCAVGPS